MSATVGDVVVHNWHKNGLHCGSGWYACAVCVSVEPFILVSLEGDMLWSCMPEHDVTALCQVHPDVLAKCQARLYADRPELKPPPSRINDHDRDRVVQL